MKLGFILISLSSHGFSEHCLKKLLEAFVLLKLRVIEVWNVWVPLANIYNRSYVSREFELKRKLQLLFKQGKSFFVYVVEYSSLCDQLSSIGNQ